MSYSLSKNRDQYQNPLRWVSGGNPKAGSFIGGDGLEKWNTGAVTSLDRTFQEALMMNADVSKWDISRVTDRMGSTFFATVALTSCNKRKIADAWASNTLFSAQVSKWAAETCTFAALTDATFKQASWGT
jgi:hypothetical protein